MCRVSDTRSLVRVNGSHSGPQASSTGVKGAYVHWRAWAQILTGWLNLKNLGVLVLSEWQRWLALLVAALILGMSRLRLAGISL